MATVDTIHDHGYELFENLQLSANEFYTTLGNMIREYQYPDVECRVEELKEGGWLSAKRQYYTIAWNRHKFLVCASPFGKSFFISWWHQEDANRGASLAANFGRLGKAMAGSMESKTFFEVDSQIMFINCITAIIKAAINRVKADKGYIVSQDKLLN